MDKIWTKADYLTWLATRPTDASEWDMKDCRSADRLIKAVTINNFDKLLDSNEIDRFTLKMVDFHFGSAEVDELLTNLKCYPSWM